MHKVLEVPLSPLHLLLFGPGEKTHGTLDASSHIINSVLSKVVCDHLNASIASRHSGLVIVKFVHIFNLRLESVQHVEKICTDDGFPV